MIMEKYLTFNVPEEYDNKSCKSFLKRYCHISARTITKLVRTPMGITRNNVLIKTIDYVYCGDIIKIKLPQEVNGIVPTQGALDIVYEDENILVVNKPYNMPVHPTKIYQTNTLANIVRYYSLKKGEDYIFRIINRIDKDTTGLVVIAKDRYTAAQLKGLYKEYTAVCHGDIVEDGTVDKKIMLKSGSKIVREVNENGKKAITHYAVIKRNINYTEILCTLETGRTHQIRCHMSYLGHPLAGDDLYGGSMKDIERQALHCSRVVFVHPITGKKIDIKSEIPEDMKNLIE